MPLILLRNMSDGLMNGTRLILLEERPHVLVCRVVNGSAAAKTVYLPRFIFIHEGPDQPLKWTRRQFPVKPCFAMTINKSQAQTLSAAAVCLVQITDDGQGGVVVDPAEAFAHGQLYVGLSRCGNPDRMCVYMTGERFRSNTLWNVVYSEVLGSASDDQAEVEVNAGSFIDSDDPRSHWTADDEFDDVPFHGYVPGATTNWEGFTTVEEDSINRDDMDTEQLLASLMPDVLSEEAMRNWDGSTTWQEAAINSNAMNADELLASIMPDVFGG